MVFTLNCEMLHDVRRINRAYELYAPGVKISRSKVGNPRPSKPKSAAFA